MSGVWWGKTLRVIAIVFMGITAFFTLAGGLGTSCVAFNPTGFGESMSKLAPFQWLYIVFVVVTTAIGVMGARAVLLLSRGRSNAYRYALIALLLGTVVGIIHILVSRSLRGKSMPVDAVVYMTVLTLVLFLILRIPRVWQGVNRMAGGAKDGTGKLGAAISMLVCGVLSLTVQFWAGPSHTWGGTNWAAAFVVTSTMFGISLLLGGSAVLLAPSSPEAGAFERRPVV
jgi:hypothetical protein